LEREAKREQDKQLAAAKAEAHRQEQERQSAAAQQAHNAGVVATIAKRVREVAIAARATPYLAEAAAAAAGAEAETAIPDAMAMQD
jgi:hypothetical protein